MKEIVLNKLSEYEEYQYNRYNEGYSSFDLILHEYSGFLDCLLALGLIPMENYQFLLDTFRDYLKTTWRYKADM